MVLVILLSASRSHAQLAVFTEEDPIVQEFYQQLKTVVELKCRIQKGFILVTPRRQYNDVLVSESFTEPIRQAVINYWRKVSVRAYTKKKSLLIPLSLNVDLESSMERPPVKNHDDPKYSAIFFKSHEQLRVILMPPLSLTFQQ